MLISKCFKRAMSCSMVRNEWAGDGVWDGHIPEHARGTGTYMYW